MYSTHVILRFENWIIYLLIRKEHRLDVDLRPSATPNPSRIHTHRFDHTTSNIREYKNVTTDEIFQTFRKPYEKLNIFLSKIFKRVKVFMLKKKQ